MKDPLAGAIYGLSALIGVAAFVYPFVLPQLQADSALAGATTAHSLDAAILTMALIAFCLIALLIELQGQSVSAKMIAALGVLVALTAVLRFIELAIPGPGGFTPIFVPILLAGYVFGARFGYLMGVMALLVSALVTGGLGPWLPYQMFVAGWMGASAGILPHPESAKHELLMLTIIAAIWGVLYGFLTNLYFWPFFTGAVAYSWLPDQSLSEAVARYLAFYLASSLVWDLFRVAGNVLMMLVLGLPITGVLVRFRDRFQFTFGQPVNYS